LWAYDRTADGSGFTENELLKEFDLHDGPGEKYRLYRKLFLEGTNDDRPVIVHLYNKQLATGEVGYWCLSDKGMASAIDYLDLKEARESSKSAKEIAFWSIGIAVVVGILQIIIALL
jgi:hypothetical protein